MFYDDPAEYKSYLPPKLQNILEIDALDVAVRSELDQFCALVKKNVNNKFPSCADEDGCTRWEKILEMSTPLNGTLQARRDAIRAKLMSKPPINVVALKAVVEAYMGLPVDITVSGYQITIKYRGESRVADLNPLYVTMWQMIPADMLVDIAYLYATWGEVKSTYPTWGDVKKKTWGQIHKGE